MADEEVFENDPVSTTSFSGNLRRPPGEILTSGQSLFLKSLEDLMRRPQFDDERLFRWCLLYDRGTSARENRL